MFSPKCLISSTISNCFKPESFSRVVINTLKLWDSNKKSQQHIWNFFTAHVIKKHKFIHLFLLRIFEKLFYYSFIEFLKKTNRDKHKEKNKKHIIFLQIVFGVLFYHSFDFFHYSSDNENLSFCSHIALPRKNLLGTIKWDTNLPKLIDISASF